MPKFANSYKQIFVYIIILLIGIEIGVVYSAHRHSQLVPAVTSTSSLTGATQEGCRDPAAVTTEPQEELLSSPQFLDPGVLRSTVQGWIHVRWRAVKGATSYNVRVWNNAGLEVKNFKTFRTFSFLKQLEVDPRLKETLYSVVVTPMGEGEVKGKDSAKKVAAMLPLRNLEPPTIKAIQTESESEPLVETPKTEIK